MYSGFNVPSACLDALGGYADKLQSKFFFNISIFRKNTVDVRIRKLKLFSMSWTLFHVFSRNLRYTEELDENKWCRIARKFSVGTRQK